MKEEPLMKRLTILALTLLIAAGPLPALGVERTFWAKQGDVAYFAQNGKIGLMGKSNIVMVGPTISEALPFDGDIAVVRERDRWGLIGKHGWIRQPFSATQIQFLGDGAYGLFCDENHAYGFVNRKGETVVEPRRYQDVGYMSEGVFAADSGQGYGYVGLDGQVKIDFQYTRALAFSEGLAAVEKDGKWGYINLRGEMVLPFQYQEAGSFVKGWAPALPEGESATVYIDQTGAVCLAGKWDRAYDFTGDDLALILAGGKYGYVNRKGKIVVTPRYEKANGFSDGFASVMAGEGDWRYLDKAGKVVSKSYAEAGSYRNGFAYVCYDPDPGKKDMVRGYINTGRKFVCVELEANPYLVPTDTP